MLSDETKLEVKNASSEAVEAAEQAAQAAEQAREARDEAAAAVEALRVTLADCFRRAEAAKQAANEAEERAYDRSCFVDDEAAPEQADAVRSADGAAAESADSAESARIDFDEVDRMKFMLGRYLD